MFDDLGYCLQNFACWLNKMESDTESNIAYISLLILDTVYFVCSFLFGKNQNTLED